MKTKNAKLEQEDRRADEGGASDTQPQLKLPFPKPGHARSHKRPLHVSDADAEAILSVAARVRALETDDGDAF